MELEIEKIEIVSADNIQVEVPNEIEISEGKKDYEVSVVKKEYTIIGDSIFIPSMYEDAPPWLKEFIDTTIDIAVNTRDQSLIDRMHSILTAIDYVPKNQYTEQINQIVGEDGIINSRIATLNSNLTDAINSTNATVAEINLTYASKDEAAAIANNVITASLSGSGEIGSALIQLQEAYATLESTTAQSISTLESVMEGEITGNATAMETIRTYVGINEVGASTGTGLSAYLESSDGTIGGADSQLANDVRVTAEGVESKFAYNSIVNINGTYKKSGFGLSTNYTSGNGTQANPYVSEFWIDASRLKFTNSNATGSVAPFTIDATGTTPEITFNGKVAFTNITGTSDLVSTSNIQNAVNNNVTAIDGGKIITGTIGANQINANAISGKIISGGIITGTSIYGSYIEGAIIKASFIDLTSTQTLTNWQQYTPANYPSAYADNFAHNNDGTLLVDSLGYVRLMGNTKLRSTVLNSNRSKDYGSYSYGSWTMDFYSYNNYKVNSINRPIISSPKISLVGIDTNATTTIIDVIAGTLYSNNISISGNIQIFNYSFDFSANVSIGSSIGTASGTITLNGISKTVSGYSGASISNTVSAKGMPITVTLSSIGTTANAEFIVTINDNEFTLSNLTDTDYIKINSLYCYSSGVYGGNPSNGEITMNINIPSFEVI